jgi:hypothetical protein
MSKDKFEISNAGQLEDGVQRSQENYVDSRRKFKQWEMLLLLGVSALTFCAGLVYLILRTLR